MGLAIGRVAAQIVSTTLQFVLAKVVPRFAIERAFLGPVLAFGLPIAAANLLSWVLLNVDNIVLARVAGPTALGFYVLAFNISSWPMSALSQMVRSISLPYFSRRGESSDGLGAVISLAWAGALPAGAVLAALSGPVIAVVYGGNWMPAAPVLAALGLYGSLRVVFDVFAAFLYSRGLSRPVLWIQVIWLVVLVVGMIVAGTTFGIVGAAWVHVLVAVVIILPAYLFALARAGVRLRQVLRAAAWPTLAALPALAVAVAVRLLIADSLTALLVGGLGAGLVYCLCIWPWVRGRLAEARALRAQPVAAEQADDDGRADDEERKERA
jgi:lipopolysaccharide exporter